MSALLAALLILAACGWPGGKTTAASPMSSAPAIATPTSLPTVPAGWNAYVDPDFGWSTGYPAGWIVFSAANTPSWKNFVTADPRIDVNQRSFRLQPGDGLLTVGLEEPAVCGGPQESLGESSSAITIGGHQALLYHRNPPSSTGATASEYVLQIVVNAHCYSVFWLFVAVPVDSAIAVVQGVEASFRFVE